MNKRFKSKRVKKTFLPNLLLNGLKTALFAVFAAFSSGTVCYLAGLEPKRIALIMLLSGAGSIAFVVIGMVLNLTLFRAKRFDVMNLFKISLLSVFGYVLLRRFGRHSIGGVIGAMCGTFAIAGFFVPQLTEAKTYVSVAYFTLLVMYHTAKSLLSLFGFNEKKITINRYEKR